MSYHMSPIVLLKTAFKSIASYFEIWTPLPNSDTSQKKKKKIPARMTYPSLAITDPRFVYTNHANTDISQTFEKAKHERLQRLQHNADGNRKQDQGTIPQVPKQKLRRVHG